eukprot:Blabericola_migrator_1__3349@NODE_198_length_11483_cov_213_989926_g171_i0_p10_GENE_NODE_198_length_11483_cov_213_989926_g171_i0NODE_198_length_11483_cov_213_989926_g171_i0_p10_ORF_typecomplete_len103_score15_60_NODE_198_length_11483_cov_213_989926_g171_i012911599
MAEYEPVFDSKEVGGDEGNWRWSLVEVEPAILDELLEQFKPPLNSAMSSPRSSAGSSVGCYLKQSGGSASSFTEHGDYITIPQVSLPSLCTDTHVIGLKQKD